MINDNVTLKDIAAVLGVSATTVHRALNGKSGISDGMREQIRQTAAFMGYNPNLAASALKRKAYRIGVLLPEPMMDNRFYCAALWDGISRFMNESGNLYAKLVEYHIPLLPSAHGAMVKEIFEHRLSDVDGLLTLAMDDSQSSYYIEKISHAGIPVVILGSDLYRGSRLCCVKAYDRLAGSLAAELITAFLPAPVTGSIILTGNPVGASAFLDQYHNLAGFQDYIQNNHPSVALHSAYCADTGQLEGLLAPFLVKDHPLLPLAVYACSARHTVQICEIIEKQKLTGTIKLVGNDAFPESIQMLHDGILTAVIDKKIAVQSYTAAKILHDYLVKNQYPEHELVQIRPEILLKSNR